MINGGNATVFVADLDRAIDFYTATLGLKLRLRASADWAEVEAGPDLVIGLHRDPGGDDRGAPPSRAIRLGLRVDGPLEHLLERLSARGVALSGIQEDDKSPVRLAHFADPDGNPLYLYEHVAAAVQP
jgi:catechol 2,3-dioxygenase-like lactoylglutathione lyase family enzyme